MDALLDPSLRRLDVEGDHTKCGLGVFLYSSKTETLRKKYTELDALWSEIVEPHKKLHESAVTINAMVASGRRDQARAYFAQTTDAFAPDLTDIDKMIAWHDARRDQWGGKRHLPR
jgi:methyl-accepting chemotaxis protein